MRSLPLAVTLLLFAATAVAPARAADERPNVVLIISDDHAWTDYGFMGHGHIRTPHLDRLASQSLLFRHGYVPSSLCCPSLASIITGLYPQQHRITCNDPPMPTAMKPGQFQRSPEFAEGRERMNRHLDAVPTLPRVLADRGYLALQSGKWWQGDFRRGGFTHGMTKGRRHGDEGLDIGRKTMQPIYDFVAEARTAGKPFFVWYAPMMPHDPHTPPERLLARYAAVAPSIHVARYWAMVEWFDETCGALLTHLDEQGLAENTVVVYLADNGWIQQVDGPRFAPKSKTSPYDGGLRTPIMIRYPGRVAPRACDRPVSSVDIATTLYPLLGIEPPQVRGRPLPGINLLDEAAVAGRPFVAGACFTHTAVDLDVPAKNLLWRWIVRDGWKLIDPAASDQPSELYHLAADPHENSDQAAAQAARVAALKKDLDGWWTPQTAEDAK